MSSHDHLPSVPPELNNVVNAGVIAQSFVPGCVAVGGTVCALYAKHRKSIDIDFVKPDLRDHFEQTRDTLLSKNDWKEARVVPPVLILGSLNQIQIGFRQLRRSIPLETTTLNTTQGQLVIPSLEELIRIKAVLAYERSALRDFVDLHELSKLIGFDKTAEILSDIEAFYPERSNHLLLELIKALLACVPSEPETELADFARLSNWSGSPELQWDTVKTDCRHIGRLLSDIAFGSTDP